MENVVVRQFERTDMDFAYKLMAREEWNTRREDVVRMDVCYRRIYEGIVDVSFLRAFRAFVM